MPNYHGHPGYQALLPKKPAVKPADPNALHVVVRFGSAIPGSIQGMALLEFERVLRKMMPGQYIETFKEAKGDDSKLRSEMTKEQRAAL